MTDKAKDPADAFREFLGQWERGVNEFANKAMESEQFSRAMHTASTAAVGARAGLNAAMERYFTAMNLPSKNDLVSIGAAIQALEARVDRIADLLERIAARAGVEAARAPAAPKPARTRKPPPRAAKADAAPAPPAPPSAAPAGKPARKARAKS